MLSDAGRALYDEIVPAALAMERKLLAALSADERTQLDAMLATLIAAADAR